MSRLTLVVFCLLLAACGTPSDPPSPAVEDTTALTFTEVSAEAGIDFTHETGAYGDILFPETNGSGGGWLDYDGDGWQDLLLVNSDLWPGQPGDRPTLALYRNDRDGTFTDVTSDAGLAVPFYGQGMAAADVDADGDTDVFVTAVGSNRFFRNNGDGTFTDDTATSGLADDAWSTSAVFFDYDGDGWLDLFVANYVDWSLDNDLYCTLDGENKSYCTPEIYDGVPSRLYRNRGDGTFEDVTEAAGVYSENGKALGATVLDVNDDGRLDLAVANDTQPDFLYVNEGDGTFSEQGLASGMALDEGGRARAGMGIDAGVVDGTGEETLFVGNFSGEMIGVYRDLGGGAFIDRAAVSNVGRSSLPFLTFAVLLFDADLDGDLDLFAANGHVQPDVERVQQGITFAQRPLLYLNDGDGRFTEVGETVGASFATPVVGRGAAVADYDRDGDLDLLLTVNGGPPRLFRNDLLASGDAARSVRVELEGRGGNREAVGALVTAEIGERTLVRRVKTGASYLSQSELAVVFGLDGAAQIDRLTVVWPDGATDEQTNIAAGETVRMAQQAL